MKKYTNEELIKEFENACFRVTNYPSNKSISKNLGTLEKELCRRLGVDPKEIIKLEND